MNSWRDTTGTPDDPTRDPKTSEALVTEAASLDRAREAGGETLIQTLVEAATRARREGRTAEAADLYREGVALLDGVRTLAAQVRAAGGQLWLARLAQDAADWQAAGPDLVAARERVLRAEDAWGRSPATTLIQLEVAARMAAAQIASRAVAAGTTELNFALRAVAGTDAFSGEDLSSVAERMARLLHANGFGGAAVTLLTCVAEYGRQTDHTSMAVRALATQGDLDARDGDDQGAYARFQEAVRELGTDLDKETTLEAARLLTRAGLSADHLGEYALAAAAYDRALRLRRRVLPPDDVSLLVSRYNVAEIARVSGDDDVAAGELGAVAAALRTLGAEAPASFRCTVLKNLGNALLGRRSCAHAKRSARPCVAAPGRERCSATRPARSCRGRSLWHCPASWHSALSRPADELALRGRSRAGDAPGMTRMSGVRVSPPP
jgi:tetratricopeptide (TPR) repeat protein